MADLVSDLTARGLVLEETHISWVFLGERDVWKVKKPVFMGFLDFRTIDDRKRACEAEVTLNRRLAAGVYHGVVPITRDAQGHHRIGGDGRPIDWAVHMTRLAREDRADVRLADGRLGSAEARRIAARLARFHAGARSDQETATFGTTQAIGVNVRENFDQSRATIHRYLTTDQAAELEVWQKRFLEANQHLIEARRRNGHVRDGHGDLRLEHVYLRDDGEIVIIDCIEFNQRFRFADVCADIAFLAMDLTWHDHADLAERFLAAYARESNDFDLYPLVDFYESYRALVRGKIAGMVAADATREAVRARADRDARRYDLLALASERRSLLPARVIAVGGVIASGKSTVADHLGEILAAPVVDSDRTRKSLLAVPATQRVPDAAFEGAYSPARTDAVYRETLRRAAAVLSSGRTVIIDASFRSRVSRAAAMALARRHDLPFCFVECRTPLTVCRQRLAERARHASVSDGRAEIIDAFVAAWEPVDELPARNHLVLDTAEPLDTTLALLDARFGPRVPKA